MPLCQPADSVIPFPEPDWKILGSDGGWERVRAKGGRAGGGSEEDLGGGGGRMGVEEVVSEVVGSWVESLEEVSEAEEGCSGADSDSDILSDGGRSVSEGGVTGGVSETLRDGGASGGGGLEEVLRTKGVPAGRRESGGLGGESEEVGGLADFLCLDLGEG